MKSMVITDLSCFSKLLKKKGFCDKNLENYGSNEQKSENNDIAQY